MMELEIELKKGFDSLKKWLHCCGEIDVVFMQDKKVNKILNPECTHAQRLKSIVSFTSLTEAKKDGASSIGIKSYSWNDFLHMMQYQMHLAEMEAAKAGMPVVYVNHDNIVEGPAIRDIHMENFNVSVGGRDLIVDGTVTLSFGRHYGAEFIYRAQDCVRSSTYLPSPWIKVRGVFVCGRIQVHSWRTNHNCPTCWNGIIDYRRRIWYGTS